MGSKTIVVMATLDTKGIEAQYLADQIHQLGHQPLLIDTGVVGTPLAKADITREEVADAGGMTLAKLLENPTRQNAAHRYRASAGIRAINEQRHRRRLSLRLPP